MMQRASFKTKLRLSFGGLLLILLTTTAVSYVFIQTAARLSAAADAKADEAFLARSVEALVNSRKTDIRSFLLSGDEEHMNKYQEHTRALAEALPDARYIEIRRAAHAPFLSHTSEFAALLTEFLRGDPHPAPHDAPPVSALASVAGKRAAADTTRPDTVGADPAALATIAAKRRRSP